MVESAVNAALSGLDAAKKDLQAAASNTANINTPSAPEGEQLPQGGYEPVQTNREAVAAGGVKSDFEPVNPRSVPVADRDAPDANADGVAYRPNVSLEEEAVRTLQAEQQYKANAKVIGTAGEMQQSLLDELS